MKQWFRFPSFAGTKLSEVGIVILIMIAIGCASHFVWGDATTIYLWLLGLSTWVFLHLKKSKTTWERFDEIDQRDMDFKDEFDKKYERLSNEMQSKADKPKPLFATPEEYFAQIKADDLEE